MLLGGAEHKPYSRNYFGTVPKIDPRPSERHLPTTRLHTPRVSQFDLVSFVESHWPPMLHIIIAEVNFNFFSRYCYRVQARMGGRNSNLLPSE